MPETNKKRTMTSDDLYRFHVLSDVQLSPDGRHVVACVQQVDREEEKKVTNLWIAGPGEGAWRPFTSGEQADSSPRWAPDGGQIAFLSNRDDEKHKQIYLIPLAGGEAQKLTDLQGEFDGLTWSPDGSRLLCRFRKTDQEVLEREADERKKKLGLVFRRYDRLFFRSDGSGYMPEERWHIWSVSAETGEATQLTDGDAYDEGAPTPSPDGSQIAFFSNRSPDPDLDQDAIELFIIPADGDEMTKVDTPEGQKMALSWSPDGQWLAYIGVAGRGNWWKNSGLWVVPADGSGPARELTAGLDQHVGNGTLGDVTDRPTAAPRWSPDSRQLIFQITRHGSTVLAALPMEGGTPVIIVGEGAVVGDFSLSDDGGTLAYLLSTTTDPGQIWLQHWPGETRRKVTECNDALLREIDLGECEEVWFKGAEGNDLQGWILRPPGFDPEHRYPSILAIHGGPWLQYGHIFMHEFYYLAAQGYVVHYCNPRGGRGYGEEHARAIHHSWGTADYGDLMAWTDLVAERPYIDRERMGVSGGSYGGYMTLWIIGHTDRFRAAVAQRVVSNLVSFVGTSDVGWVLEDAWASEARPWEDIEQYWRQSPMAYIGQAKTPTLIIHSEQDMRCHLEQGLQAYTALKRLGVESELLLFPEESHGLSRGGRTDRRVARLAHISRWFQQYL
jgi:dipeptidyl aminopeptidase/acylaminoacyl peptidase